MEFLRGSTVYSRRRLALGLVQQRSLGGLVDLTNLSSLTHQYSVISLFTFYDHPLSTACSFLTLVFILVHALWLAERHADILTTILATMSASWNASFTDVSQVCYQENGVVQLKFISVCGAWLQIDFGLIKMSTL